MAHENHISFCLITGTLCTYSNKQTKTPQGTNKKYSYYFHVFQYVSEKFSGIFFTLQIVTDCCIQNVHLNILSIAYLTLTYKAFFFWSP